MPWGDKKTRARATRTSYGWGKPQQRIERKWWGDRRKVRKATSTKLFGRLFGGGKNHTTPLD